MLSPETRKAFYETLGDYAIATNNLDTAVKAYEKAGFKEGFIKIGDKYVEKGQSRDAIEAYEKAGLASGTKSEMKKLADLYEKAGKGRKAMELRRKIATKK